MLGFSRVNIAGHDIGSMVAFSFAVNHAEATRKVALLDVVHPNDGYFEFRMLAVPGQPFFPWWFAFNQVQGLPEKLVIGRSRFLTDHMFDYLLRNPSAIDNRDRAIYADRYSYPDAIRGGNGWYQKFVEDIEHGKTYGLVTAPMLGMAHDLFFPDMAARLPAQGTDVRLLQVNNTGHYFVEEQPQSVIDAFNTFFA